MPRPDITTDVVLAEAAAWLVRLQSAERTPALKAAFDAWIADPAHARAFERATETWEIIPGAARVGETKVSRVPRLAWPVLASGVCIVLIVCCLLFFRTEQALYETRPGQQQTVALSDGTRVTLNTGSTLTVAYTFRERRVQLVRGEAIFEVSKDAHRPFYVSAGNDEVEALGTIFTVRTDVKNLTVVLVEGSVLVTRRLPHEGRLVNVTTLSPGERLKVPANGAPAVDRPTIDEQLAWLRGQVSFNDSPLIDAVAELNRYGGPPLMLADPALGELRISGVFQTHDAAEFAAAVARLEGLELEHRDGAIVLAR